MTLQGRVTVKRGGVTRTRRTTSAENWLVLVAFFLLGVVPWLVGCLALLMWLIRP